MHLPLSSEPASLCLLRLSAIGDIMHMVPVVRTLQQQWPNCKISWIIGKLEASLVGDLPGVEFIIFDKSAGLKSLLDLRRRLHGRRFDILLHMQVALRASLISLAIKAPLRLGFDRARAHDYQWLFTNQRIDAKPKQHVLDGFFGFLEKLGITTRVLSWNIPIPQDAETFIDRQLSGQPLLVINPCSSARLRNWRNWPAHRYGKIADYVAKQYQMQVALSGGPAAAEVQMANDICRLADSEIVNLVGKTSLKQMLALLRRASVVISPDTGPAHMATAVGTPVIGLYASSNPLRTGPYLSQQWTVNRYADAALQFLGKSVDQLNWGQRIRDPRAMELISVDDVIEKIDLLLNKRKD